MPTEKVTHADGRVCRYLPYAMDGVQGLLHGWFYQAPPDMRKCDRAHGLNGEEGASDEPGTPEP